MNDIEILHAKDIVDEDMELEIIVRYVDEDGKRRGNKIRFHPTTLSSTELWRQAAEVVAKTGIVGDDDDTVIELWEPTQERMVKTHRTVDDATGHVDDYWHVFYPELGEDW